MNSTEIFTLALGLSSPWKVVKTELTSPDKKKAGELHIHIDFEPGAKFLDDTGTLCPVYDSEERTWRHLNFFEHTCYLHARVPRYSHSVDKKVRTVQVPWARAESKFTLMFEAFAMLLIEYEMPVNKVGDALRVIPHRIWRVFNYWVKRAVQKDNLSGVKNIGIDETSSKKGHSYVTIVADMDTHRVIHVAPGKDAATVASFIGDLQGKQGKAEDVESVCMDMSPAFIGGALEHLPNAQIVFDKFHLVQMLNKAMDTVRKAERKECEMIKGHKYTFLHAYRNLNKDQKENIHELMLMYPKLGEAYRLKELFSEVWLIEDSQEAKGYLAFWCDMAVESGIFAYQKFVATIQSHWDGICAYFDKKLTNGILEGINSKIQLAKRRARGYRNIQNFINMIYFLTAKLKFDYPPFPLT
jgi:transposase